MRPDKALVQPPPESEPDAPPTFGRAETETYCFLLLGYPDLCCDNCVLCQEMYAYDDEPGTDTKDKR